MCVDDEEINPFSQVVETACTVTKSRQWLYQRDENWQIGTRNEFPGSYLFIREVSKTMVDFITKHFDTLPQHLVKMSQTFTNL